MAAIYHQLSCHCWRAGGNTKPSNALLTKIHGVFRSARSSTRKLCSLCSKYGCCLKLDKRTSSCIIKQRQSIKPQQLPWATFSIVLRVREKQVAVHYRENKADAEGEGCLLSILFLSLTLCLSNISGRKCAIKTSVSQNVHVPPPQIATSNSIHMLIIFSSHICVLHMENSQRAFFF